MIKSLRIVLLFLFLSLFKEQLALPKRSSKIQQYRPGGGAKAFGSVGGSKASGSQRIGYQRLGSQARPESLGSLGGSKKFGSQGIGSQGLGSQSGFPELGKLGAMPTGNFGTMPTGNLGGMTGGNFGAMPAGGQGVSGLGTGGLGNMLSAGTAGSTGNESSTSACTKYKIISARGTGELQGGTTVSSGYVSGVLAAVPGGAKYDVQYPASMDYMEGPIQGASDAMRYITQQNSLCPKQLYVLNGYSEGAMVITQLVNKLKIPSALIVSIVLYGNPYFKGGAHQDACASKTGSGIAAAMGMQIPSKYTGNVFDCCASGDMICQTRGSMVAHMSYAGSQEQKRAVAFATGRLQRALKGLGSTIINPSSSNPTNTGD